MNQCFDLKTPDERGKLIKDMTNYINPIVRTLTLKNGHTIYTSIVKVKCFPEYNYAIMKLLSDNSSFPRLICPVTYFKDTNDETIYVRPVTQEPNDFWWRSIFQRPMDFDEAVAIKADYTLEYAYEYDDILN